MRIPRFYCSELNAASEVIELPAAAHRHAIQVLRMKPGEALRVFDGNGLEYQAILDQVAKRGSIIRLGNKIEIDNESSLNITLLQGISRGERMDYAIQKAVELGVNSIVPVVTERCNVQLSNGRADKRLAHWQGVMVSACEQSGRSMLPELSDVISLDDVLAKDYGDENCHLVLDPQADKGFTELKQYDDVALLIGPEGGLTEQEVQQANRTGFQSVRIGPRVLRTETAAIAAIAIVQTMWGDLG
ncbi:MAG: 16S rRNA (uracil(1498)-N(3))-methyltransferase [Methylophagaceae bacterium]